MIELGELLKTQRDKLNISLEKVTADTRIASQILKDIENGKLDYYAGDEQYVKMYIKKYAAYLKLNPEEIVGYYIAYLEEKKSLTVEEEKNVTKNYNNKKNKIGKREQKTVYMKRNTDKYVKIALVVFLSAIVIFGTWVTLKTYVWNNEAGFKEGTGKDDVDGDVEDPTPKDPEDEDPTGEDPTDEDPGEEPNGENPQSSEVTINKVSDFEYDVIVPKGVTEIEFKASFKQRTWVEIYKNDRQPIEGFTNRIFNNNGDAQNPDVATISVLADGLSSISVHTGHGRGFSFMINNVELAFAEEGLGSNPIAIVFNFKGEE